MMLPMAMIPASAASPSIDAPVLAAPGQFAVGVRRLTITDKARPDVLAPGVPARDRALDIDIWYPAVAATGASPVTYRAAFPAEPPRPPVAFTVPGTAFRDAAPVGGHYPLVIVSHGYSNDPAAMAWLTENLASKGYVVAAIRHEDPPITDGAGFVGPLFNRPLDIAFAARQLSAILGREGLIDAGRIALVGYSMGGYGVLTAGGAVLDPAGGAVHLVPGNALKPYAGGGERAAELTIPGLKAVVAMSPAGGGTLDAWGAQGLAGIKVPLLLISGDADRTVDYASGARTFFAAATASRRWLLTFHGAGHAIGLGPAPVEMRSRLWDLDWFEDPVWRKDRLNAISLHFITAFLDAEVKGIAASAGYLDVVVPQADAGVWPSSVVAPYDAISNGQEGVTVWKGFPRNHARGLELLHAEPR